MILAAARAEFAQYGLAGARIDRIARTAQAGKERIYAHFRDKETLFREVLAADSTEFFEAISLRRGTVPTSSARCMTWRAATPSTFA